MSRGRHTSSVVSVPPQERQHLSALVRQTAIRAGVRRRARLVLLLAAGHTITDVAARVGLSRRHVYTWLWRWQAVGVEGLDDLPGRGGARRGGARRGAGRPRHESGEEGGECSPGRGIRAS